MVFSSITFLFCFFPLFILVYYAVPFKFKNGTLLIFSLIFYAWGEPRYMWIMLFVTLSDYSIGLCMERFGDSKGKRRALLCASIVIDLSFLSVFKYADFAINTLNTLFGLGIEPLRLELPIGISFFTFQTMSYIFDLYRGEIKAERSYLNYLTYVSMFPQLIAGPVVRYSLIKDELGGRQIKAWQIEEGFTRFLRGLFKKVLIANRIGELWEEIRALPAAELSADISTDISVCTAWLGAIIFTLQLYYDFSAYSDMAIGIGRMLGFRFMENFNYPLKSLSITEFWRRWHISMSTWFRDYVYFPLGGNRVSVPRHIFNMLAVWSLTGLWHGASWNYVLWGLFHFAFLVGEKYIYGKRLERLPKIVRHIYSIALIVVGFVIFYFEDMAQMQIYLKAMLHMSGNAFFGTELLWYLENNWFIIAAAVIFAFPVYPKLKELASSWKIKDSIFVKLAAATAYMALFIVTTAYLVNDTYNPFLYFRF